MKLHDFKKGDKIRLEGRFFKNSIFIIDHIDTTDNGYVWINYLEGNLKGISAGRAWFTEITMID